MARIAIALLLPAQRADNADVIRANVLAGRRSWSFIEDAAHHCRPHGPALPRDCLRWWAFQELLQNPVR
jgi:hypothetical protein